MAVAMQGCRVTAVDPNRAMEPYAAKNAAAHHLDDFQLVEGIAESLPFEDATFDRAVCTLVRPSKGADLVCAACCLDSVPSVPGPGLCIMWTGKVLMYDARRICRPPKVDKDPFAICIDTANPHRQYNLCKVFCSVPDLKASLKEVKRVLKPSGKLLFWDHVYAEDSRPLTRLGQNVLNPLQQAIADGCHLNRSGALQPQCF